MNEKIELVENEEIEWVFSGTGNQTGDAGSCDDECVGGTANTSAMFATN